MNAIEEIKKNLYESYKWLYEENMESFRRCLDWAKERRLQGHRGWAIYWLESAALHRKMVLRYKRSMEFYAN